MTLGRSKKELYLSQNPPHEAVNGKETSLSPHGGERELMGPILLMEKEIREAI